MLATRDSRWRMGFGSGVNCTKELTFSLDLLVCVTVFAKTLVSVGLEPI